MQIELGLDNPQSIETNGVYFFGENIYVRWYPKQTPFGM
jgi:hypothetical protein